ncbi:UNKNOWN [Stylonychia lemnae]|uniref:Uncharacterized protein n=1 Tax=Stylonychia lemnae TaxID=5949 RepID=A0A078AF20_STYLE|nr:UNKNOWN [Stylonychia lemnae]|eukprot:CDW80815.1 UNKNOWN [Stylonychia lemnae]
MSDQRRLSKKITRGFSQQDINIANQTQPSSMEGKQITGNLSQRSQNETYDRNLTYVQRLMVRLDLPELNDNQQFIKIKNAISNFYSSAECHNHQSYISIFYKSLVNMILHWSRVNEYNLKVKNLNKIYQWFELKRRKMMGLPQNDTKISPGKGDLISDMDSNLRASQNFQSLIVEDIDQMVKSGSQSVFRQSMSPNTLLMSPMIGNQSLSDFDKYILTTKKSKIKFDVDARTQDNSVKPAKDRIFEFKRRQLVRQDSMVSGQTQNSKINPVRVLSINDRSSVTNIANNVTRPDTAATINVGNRLSMTSSLLRPGTTQTANKMMTSGNFSAASFMSPGHSAQSFFSPQNFKSDLNNAASNNDRNSMIDTQTVLQSSIRPQTQQNYTFKNVKFQDYSISQKQLSYLPIDFTIESKSRGQDFQNLDSISNFYTVGPSSTEDDLRLTKYWFANANKQLQEKRADEEKQVILKEWSVAKQRIQQEISSKQERMRLISDPTKLAVMKSTIKVNINKIYKNQDEFLDSDQSSLNTTKNSDYEEEQKQKEAQKKLVIQKPSQMRVVDYDYDNENNDLRSDDNYDEYRVNSDEDYEYQDNRKKNQKEVVVEEVKKPEKRKPKIAQILDFTSKKKTEDEYNVENQDQEKFGSNIEGIELTKEEDSSEEETEDGRVAKKKVKPPVNAASLVGIDQKKLKILKIRQTKGDIIRASINSKPQNDEVLDNIFTIQDQPDTLTMSLYNRPVTTKQNLTGLHPTEKINSVFSTKNRKLINEYTQPEDLFALNDKQSNNFTDFRPKTVGYSTRPQRLSIGQNKVVLEDRNSHIGGCLLEQLQEIKAISQYLSRQSSIGKLNLKTESDKNLSSKNIVNQRTNRMAVSLNTLKKAILLPSDTDTSIKQREINPMTIGLMVNPFQKAAKGKKAKKKKA